MTYRLVVKEVAMRHDPRHLCPSRSFWPERQRDAHAPILFRGDTNAFFDPTALPPSSKIARHYIAGLLRHIPEVTSSSTSGSTLQASGPRLRSPDLPLLGGEESF